MNLLQSVGLAVVCAIGLDTRCPSEVIEDAAARGCVRARTAAAAYQAGQVASGAPLAMDPVEWCWRSLSRSGCGHGDWDCRKKARDVCTAEVARHRRFGSRYCPPPNTPGVAAEQLNQAELTHLGVSKTASNP